MTELTTEPGTLALAISDALVQGREICLSRLQVAALSEYERQVLQRTALRLNRRISYNFDTGTVSIEKAHP